VSLPPKGIIIAAERWGRLLATSTVTQARALLETDTRYLDLSSTQYGAALDWLIEIGVLTADEGPARLRPELAGASVADLKEAIYRAGLEAASPPWLADADLYAETTADVPADGEELANALGVSAGDAIAAIRQVHGKIDLEARAAVGASGELAIVALLQAGWPSSARHVALTDDGLGYDVAATTQTGTWHLEVKTSVRRGRLLIYLSRQELEISKLDPHWRLVVAGLGHDQQLAAVATVDPAVLQARAPADQHLGVRWASARYELKPGDLHAGLAFLGAPRPGTPEASSALLACGGDRRALFAWMPSS
jgi:hypothetical protein